MARRNVTRGEIWDWLQDHGHRYVIDDDEFGEILDEDTLTDDMYETFSDRLDHDDVRRAAYVGDNEAVDVEAKMDYLASLVAKYAEAYY